MELAGQPPNSGFSELLRFPSKTCPPWAGRESCSGDSSEGGPRGQGRARGGRGGGGGDEGGGLPTRDRSPLSRAFCGSGEYSFLRSDDESCCAHGNCGDPDGPCRPFSCPPVVEFTYEDYDDFQTPSAVTDEVPQENHREPPRSNEVVFNPRENDFYTQGTLVSEESLCGSEGQSRLETRDNRTNVRPCDHGQDSGPWRGASHNSHPLLSLDFSCGCEGCKPNSGATIVESWFLKERNKRRPRASSCPPDLEVSPKSDGSQEQSPRCSLGCCDWLSKRFGLGFHGRGAAQQGFFGPHEPLGLRGRGRGPFVPYGDWCRGNPHGTHGHFGPLGQHGPHGLGWPFGIQRPDCHRGFHGYKGPHYCRGYPGHRGFYGHRGHHHAFFVPHRSHGPHGLHGSHGPHTFIGHHGLDRPHDTHTSHGQHCFHGPHGPHGHHKHWPRGPHGHHEFHGAHRPHGDHGHRGHHGPPWLHHHRSRGHQHGPFSDPFGQHSPWAGEESLCGPWGCRRRLSCPPDL